MSLGASLLPSQQPLAQSQAQSKTVPCSHCGLPVPAGLLKPDATEQFCCAGCGLVYAAVRAHGLERYYCMQASSPGELAPARPSGRKFLELDNPEFLDAYAPRMQLHEGTNGKRANAREPNVTSTLRTIEFFLEGVHCSACVWLVEKLPRVAEGVLESRLDLGRAMVRVVWDEEKTTLSRVAQSLDSLGYAPHVGRNAKSRELRQRDNRRLLVKIAVAGAGAGNVMLLAFALYGGSFHGMEHQYSALFRWMSLGIGLVVLLGPGSLFFRGAIAAVRTRTAHLDLPIAIGLAAGTIAGTFNTILDRGEIYFDSLTALVFLLLVGRYIQRRLEQRATDTVERLFSLTPSFARLHNNGSTQEVPIESLELDQVVEVRPGESFPADGCVLEGNSSVDISLLTGESRPVAIQASDLVFAGALNVERPVLARVTALGRDTRVGRLLTLMQECALRKAPIVQLADRVAGHFTVAALILFVATYLGWRFIDAPRALDHAVTLLIVSCPCGLGLATPFAVSIALGRAARGAILVKGGEFLEKLAFRRTQRPTIFLDKTGTLTDPGLFVIEWHGGTDVERRLRHAVAALESKVNHPIARALAEAPSLAAPPLAEAPSLAAPPTTPIGSVELVRSSRNGIDGRIAGARLLIGSASYVTEELAQCAADRVHPLSPQWAETATAGLSARGHTPVWVAVDGAVAAVVGVGSRIRPDAAATVESLRRRGLKVVILSGDDPDTVTAVGEQLGLSAENCLGGLSPEDKVQIVETTMRTGPVFMVGDGVNDAAALSAATVGIAVHGGAEASLAAADAYLGHNGVGVLVELLDGASRTMSIIRRCLVVSLGYNVLAAALAVSGSINALSAAVLMPLASFTVLSIALLSQTFTSGKASLPAGHIA